MDETKGGWFLLSGTIALLGALTLFFTLIVSMLYVPPIIRPAIVESVSVDLVLEDVHLQTPRAEESAPVAQPGAPAQGVRELFGDVNATYTPDRVTTRTPPQPATRAPRIELEGDLGHPSRLPPEALELQERTSLARPGTGERTPASTTAPEGTVEDRYLAAIHARLASAWHPGHGDLDKMAAIEMRISAQGVVRYRVIRVRGDQPFRERLERVLDQIVQEGLEPPPRPLRLNVNFIVKE